MSFDTEFSRLNIYSLFSKIYLLGLPPFYDCGRPMITAILVTAIYLSHNGYFSLHVYNTSFEFRASSRHVSLVKYLEHLIVTFELISPVENMRKNLFYDLQ